VSHPSAASLNLHLPLSPVVAPAVNGGDASDASAFAAAAPGVEPTSPRSPRSPRMTRSSSSRQYCAALLQRPGTEVYTWGRGDCGQLGTGSLEDSPVPAVVKGLRGRNILTLAAGAFDTAMVTGEGHLTRCLCWCFAAWRRQQRSLAHCRTLPTCQLVHATNIKHPLSRSLSLPKLMVSCMWWAAMTPPSWASGSRSACRSPPACRVWRAAKWTRCARPAVNVCVGICAAQHIATLNLRSPSQQAC